MTFADLYGSELDKALGSQDTDLFTTAKRKAEIMAKRGTLRGHDPVRCPWHEIEYIEDLM